MHTASSPSSSTNTNANHQQIVSLLLYLPQIRKKYWVITNQVYQNILLLSVKFSTQFSLRPSICFVQFIYLFLYPVLFTDTASSSDYVTLKGTTAE